MAANKPRILVYRNKWLPISETFIYNQSVRLQRYDSFFLGARPIQGPHIPIPPDRLQLINDGGIKGLLREILFKLFGYIPENIIGWARNLNPALIHAHFGPDGSMVLPLAMKLEIPLVVSFLGTDATLMDKYARRSYLAQRLYLKRRKLLAEKVTKVVVPSEYLKECLVERHGFPVNKIHIIHHGVDLKQFSTAGKPPEWGHILYVGRLVPRKGLQYLIDALQIVKNRFRDVKLTIIGDGPLREDYESQARQKLGSGFAFLGGQSHETVRDYMERAYLFSMPSITMASGETETFGLVFAEAHALGVPVVSFNSGAISEVVSHGETGLLAEEGNVDMLSNHILKLLEDPDQRHRMGKLARERVERLFDLEKQNAVLESFYDDILQERKFRNSMNDPAISPGKSL